MKTGNSKLFLCLEDPFPLQEKIWDSQEAGHNILCIASITWQKAHLTFKSSQYVPVNGYT